MSVALTTYMVADSRDVHPNSEGLRIEWYIAPPTGVAMPLRMTNIGDLAMTAEEDERQELNAHPRPVLAPQGAARVTLLPGLRP